MNYTLSPGRGEVSGARLIQFPHLFRLPPERHNPKIDQGRPLMRHPQIPSPRSIFPLRISLSCCLVGLFLSASIGHIFAIPMGRAVTLRLPARIRPVASSPNIAAGFFMSVIGHLQCKFPHHQQNSNAIWKYQVDKRYICFRYISRTARCAFHRPPANRAAGCLTMGLPSFSS